MWLYLKTAIKTKMAGNSLTIEYTTHLSYIWDVGLKKDILRWSSQQKNRLIKKYREIKQELNKLSPINILVITTS